MKNPILWMGAALTLLLAGACFTQFERVTVEDDRGFQGRAAYDSLFAAELLFEELGLPMERPLSWQKLPPVTHTILLPGHSFRAPMPVDRLLDWVRSGGHLVVAGALGADGMVFVESPEEEDEDAFEEESGAEEIPEEQSAEEEDSADPLLTPLGLEILDSDASRAAAEGDFEEQPEEGLEALDLGRGDRRVRIEQRVHLHSPRVAELELPDAESEEDRDFSLVRVSAGEGWVTVLSDADFLTNAEIGDHDHAAFAWDVVAPPERIPEGLSVFFRTGYAPWFELLTSFAWKALLSGAFALGIFLWSRGSRFGPVSSSVPPERRSLLEHVSASGKFLWRNRLGEVLLQSCRSRTLTEAAERDPSVARLPEKEKIRYLAVRAGLSGGQLAAALEERSVEDPAEFLRIVRTLESVRRASGLPNYPAGDDDDLARIPQ